MIQSQNHSPISLVQATLFVAIAILAIATILFQLGQASFRLGQSTRKLNDSLDGTGGPVKWLQFAYNCLRPEAFQDPGLLFETSLLTDTVAQEIQPESCDIVPASLLTCGIDTNYGRLNQSSKIFTHGIAAFRRSTKLETLSVKELRLLAKARKIKQPHKLKKAELICQLQEA